MKITSTPHSLAALCCALLLCGCVTPRATTISSTPGSSPNSTPNSTPNQTTPPLTDWPRVQSSIARDEAMEARIRQMVAGMSLAQKIGQMTQPEIKSITPEQVREFYIGSVLNGGGSWPSANKHASVADWLDLAERYHQASLATAGTVKVPLIWGTDAVHGHNNVFGATIFPHNIGLGAAHDSALVNAIGQATGKAVRATGINWVFAPTLAVAQDDRWGRTYESFSEDATLVGTYGKAYVAGLQGSFNSDANVVATAKHYIGDGGTDLGRDQGNNLSTRAEMINRHGQGYYGALASGVQTVMASFNSWYDRAAGVDYGKMHGSKALLSEALKDKMDFDGFVISDWNGIGQVPGCTNSRCAQAINAGVDMIMVPDDWKAFIANTVAQVESGEIAMSRIDNAVSRILRVKLRAGLFDKSPAQGAHAGKVEATQARALARQAVRESLVLLKNDAQVLPLAHGKRLLVVGKSADSLRNQTGGWSLSWQGDDNNNADFPNGDTLLAGLREHAAQVVFSETGREVDPRQFDAVIAVLGETPYAEMLGDISAPTSLQHSLRHPEDLAALRAVTGQGVPVVTVYLSGRPLYVNDLLNLSDAFVAAWLPGSEGKGVADVLFKTSEGKVAWDFHGTLSFSWPRSACQSPINQGDKQTALFPLGYGLTYTSSKPLGRVEEGAPLVQCGPATQLPIFSQAERAPYALYAASAANGWNGVALGTDLNKVHSLPADNPALVIRTVDVNTQQDARQVSWKGGAARLYARSAQATDLTAYAKAGSLLQFDILPREAPQGRVNLAMDCPTSCRGELDLSEVLTKLALNTRHNLKIPLACFTVQGVKLDQVDTVFSVETDRPFSAAFANILIRVGEAGETGVLDCARLGAVGKR